MSVPAYVPPAPISDADAAELDIRADLYGQRVEKCADWLLRALESEGWPTFPAKGALVRWAFTRVTERLGRTCTPSERAIVLDAVRGSLYGVFGFVSSTAPVGAEPAPAVIVAPAVVVLAEIENAQQEGAA